MLKQTFVPVTAWYRKTWDLVGGDRLWEWKKRKVAAV